MEMGELENQETRVSEIHSLVHRLPEKNRQMLQLLMNHLANISITEVLALCAVRAVVCTVRAVGKEALATQIYTLKKLRNTQDKGNIHKNNLTPGSQTLVARS
ncbi:hypothetical protein A6R68_22079, partial [Neotoma lepida]